MISLALPFTYLFFVIHYIRIISDASYIIINRIIDTPWRLYVIH